MTTFTSDYYAIIVSPPLASTNITTTAIPAAEEAATRAVTCPAGTAAVAVEGAQKIDQVFVLSFAITIPCTPSPLNPCLRTGNGLDKQQEGLEIQDLK
jgi:hypothetical protein